MDAFDPDARTAEDREDRCQELSVNLEDDAGALAEIRGRRKINAVARIETWIVEDLVQRNELAGVDRSRKPDNPYHGDILFLPAESTTPWRVKAIAGYLAVNATRADV